MNVEYGVACHLTERGRGLILYAFMPKASSFHVHSETEIT
jgi:hypothetical protein